MKTIPSFRHLSDAQLATTVDGLAHDERHSTVALIAGLAEFDERLLHLPLGFPSLFSYCTKHLRMSEGAAYDRIEAARAARRFPVILERLATASITLSTIGLVGRHLTTSNHADLLTECHHKSKREVEVIVARLAPKPDAVTMIRRVPALTPLRAPAPDPLADNALAASQSVSAVSTLPASPTPVPQTPARPVIAPLSPERFKLQVTISQAAHDDLRQLQDLMRHTIPSGDAARIVERALKVLLKEVLRRKCGIVDRPRRGDAVQKLIDAPPVH